jgi:uncharacterized protein YjiS (DUF1127 family)
MKGPKAARAGSRWLHALAQCCDAICRLAYGRFKPNCCQRVAARDDPADQGGCHPPGSCGVRPAGAGLLEIAPLDLLNDTMRIWAMHREFRSVLAELAHHSDRELRELGIGRGDIARVAYEEAERRIVTPAAARNDRAEATWPAIVAAPGR